MERADVLVQNLGPGAIERLGFAPEELRRRFPRLVICSISGYGRGGPYEQRKAFDLLLQGETGVIATTGTAEAPAKLGISVGDIGAGVYGAMATLAALYERRATGQGRLVETSLFDALAEWMGYPVPYTKYGGEAPGPGWQSPRDGDPLRHLPLRRRWGGQLRRPDRAQWRGSAETSASGRSGWPMPAIPVPPPAAPTGRNLETAIEEAFAEHPRDEI